MTNRHWREMVEIVGVIGIVASMILIAAELRKTNEIAATRAEMALAAQHNILNERRATNTDVAKLFPKLESPEAHLVTATDASQIRGIARHQINFLRSVQNAYKDELISRRVRDAYVLDFAQSIDRWPGIREHYVAIYRETEALHGLEEFAAIAELAAAESTPGPASRD